MSVRSIDTRAGQSPGFLLESLACSFLRIFCEVTAMYPKPYIPLVLALFSWQVVAAQTPPPDNRKPVIAQDNGNKGPAVRERAQQARHVLREMAKFPAEVRDAIPIVAQHPDLPGKLNDLVKKDEVAYINQILANYPKEVQNAVRAMLPWPKAIELMAMHANLMRMFGDIAKKDGLATMQTIFKELESEGEQSDEAVIAWAKRLQSNKTAVYRYLEAMTAYAQEKKDADFQDYRYGVIYIAKDNTATVYAMPPAPFTTYVFVNADLYPELADEMVEQWLHTDGRTEFDDVMQRAWVVYRQVFKEDFFHPEGRAERLRAAALLGKNLGDGFKDGKITLLLRNPNLEQQAANLPALQQFILKEGNMTLAREDEKPKVPRKAEAIANLPERPARVVRVKDQPPTEPSPGSEPPAKPVETQQTVWYWYQTNLPVVVDTPFFNGLTPLFLGSSRLPPVGRHPQALPDTPVPPSGSTGTTIQEQARTHPAFRRPPFVPDPLNRGGASSGNQPRIPGGVSVPANMTPTDPSISSVGRVIPPGQTPSGTTGQTPSGTTGANVTTLNRGGSTLRPSANTQAMPGGQGANVQGRAPGTTGGTNPGARSSVLDAPPTFVEGPGDGWRRYPGIRPPGFPPGTGGGGVTNPGTGGGIQGPPTFVEGPGDGWRRYPGIVPPWWRVAPMNQVPNRPMVPNRPAAPRAPRR
jgi:hypothetical protein